MGMEKFAKPARATWNVVQKADDLFEVRDPDGEVYATRPTLHLAATLAGNQQKVADRAARRMTRNCMCCRTPFESEGIHNRLCSRCRMSGGEWNPYGIAPRSGRPR